MFKNVFSPVIVFFLFFSIKNINSAATSEGDYLIDLVKKDDIETLKKVSSSVVNINARDKEGRTALIWAGILSNKQIAMILFLEKNAVISIEDFQGKTFKDYNADLFNKLKKEKRMKEVVLLNNIAKSGDVDAVERTLSESRGDIDARDYFGNSAFITSSTYGQHALVEKLIDLKANVNLMDYSGRTGLSRAIEGNHTETIKILLKNRALLSPLDLVRAVSNKCSDPYIAYLLLENGGGCKFRIFRIDCKK